MSNFFHTLIEFASKGWDFLCNMAAMLFSAVTMVITGLSGMQVIIQFMPAVIGAGAIVSIAILVVRFLCLK